MTVAIPVLDGRRWLPDVLEAIRTQQIDREVELLVCDSGSRDGSADLARQAGARVIGPGASGFHHAETRNLLMREARGEFVAMLTQDAQPASSRWLATLLAGFETAEDVALVYGPYLPRPDCPRVEAGRLERFFAALSPDGRPRVDRLSAAELASDGGPVDLGPARGYFSDANGCIRRAAWEAVPYPPAAYAEDHALAVAMLRAGWAKVLMPEAGVLHSHHYRPVQRFRRAFDDYRGLREIYDHREPADPRYLATQLRGAGGAGLRGARAAGASWPAAAVQMLGAVTEQVLQVGGAILGSRADLLPPAVRRRLSYERRASFEPMDSGHGPGHR